MERLIAPPTRSPRLEGQARAFPLLRASLCRDGAEEESLGNVGAWRRGRCGARGDSSPRCQRGSMSCAPRSARPSSCSAPSHPRGARSTGSGSSAPPRAPRPSPSPFYYCAAAEALDRLTERLLYNHPVARAAPEGFGVVHLFGLRRRDDEGAGRGRARDVGIIVDAVPQQRRESLDAVVPKVLVLEPGTHPPPPGELRGLRLLVFGDAA